MIIPVSRAPSKRTTSFVCTLLLFVSLFLISSQVQAVDYTLLNGVFGNGGGVISGSGYIVDGTVGQPCVGVVSNGSYQIMSGIGHDIYGVLWTDVLDNYDWGSTLPPSFSLSQNYPNPFNPTTTIAFTLPRQSSVRMTLYNILGQKVATLVDGELSAGKHEVTLNGDGLSSGVYYYRIEAEDFVKTKKLVLLK